MLNQTWLRIVLIVGGFVIFVPLCLLLLGIEQKAGYYVCPNCGKKDGTRKLLARASKYFYAGVATCKIS